MEWAEERVHSGKFKKAAVPGAVLQLGRCCDFLDSNLRINRLISPPPNPKAKSTTNYNLSNSRYSALKLFTGFATAALTALMLTVISAMVKVSMAARANTHQLSVVL